MFQVPYSQCHQVPVQVELQPNSNKAFFKTSNGRKSNNKRTKFVKRRGSKQGNKRSGEGP